MNIFAQAVNFLLSYFPTFYYICLFLGAASLLQVLFQMLQGAGKLFRRRINFRQRYGQGAWALVTGGSEGIGRQLACQLARSGMNIVLLSRTQGKLKFAQEYIKKRHPAIKVEYIVADLAKQAQKQNIADVLPQLDTYDFSIVANNAGADVLDYYHNLSVQEIFKIINLNCLAVLALNYKYAMIFKEKTKGRKHCAILNVGSIAGQVAIPLFDIYTASKGYVTKLTKNLSMELPQIDWILLNPSEVSTYMTCFKNLDLMTITPEQCAEGTLNDWAQDVVTNGHINHKIQGFLYSIVPMGLFNFVWLGMLAPQFMKERKEFYQKMKNRQS